MELGTLKNFANSVIRALDDADVEAVSPRAFIKLVTEAERLYPAGAGVQVRRQGHTIRLVPPKERNLSLYLKAKAAIAEGKERDAVEFLDEVSPCLGDSYAYAKILRVQTFLNLHERERAFGCLEAALSTGLNALKHPMSDEVRRTLIKELARAYRYERRYIPLSPWTVEGNVHTQRHEYDTAIIHQEGPKVTWVYIPIDCKPTPYAQGDIFIENGAVDAALNEAKRQVDLAREEWARLD
jgi:tetratricopeptide (TPR) repeat protein